MTSIDDIPIQPDKSNKATLRQNIGVGVSVIALTISLLSLWISYTTSRIQKAEARPHLTAFASRLTRVDTNNFRDLTLWIDVRNDGELPVSITRIDLKPRIDTVNSNEARAKCFKDLANSNFSGPETGTSILNTHTTRLSLFVRLPQSCSDGGWYFFADATFVGHYLMNRYYEQQPENIPAVVVP